MNQPIEQSKEREKQEFILYEDQVPKETQFNTLLKRYYRENEETRFSCEVWTSATKECKTPTLVCYLSDKLHQESLDDSWKFFKKIWSDQDYWAYIQEMNEDETIH